MLGGDLCASSLVSLVFLCPADFYLWTIMQHYTLTDEETVARISDFAPRTMSAYFLCLHKANDLGRCIFTRDEIMHDRVRSWTKFKNDIRTLASMFILNFLDKGDTLEIQLITEGIE